MRVGFVSERLAVAGNHPHTAAAANPMFPIRLTYSPLFLLVALASGCESSTAADDGPGNDNTEQPSSDSEIPPPAAQSCPGESEDAFAWSWSYFDDLPEFDEDAALMGEIDAVTPLECSVAGFDQDADALVLDLNCSAGGVPTQMQQFTVSPTPAPLLAALTLNTPMELFFQPVAQCNNGCNVSIPAGWLTLRDTAEDRLLLAIVDAPTLFPAAHELAPLEFGVHTVSCGRTADGSGCEPDGWVQGLDVSVAADGDRQTLVHAGSLSVGGYQVQLDSAVQGAYDSCTADGGERGRVEMLLFADGPL